MRLVSIRPGPHSLSDAPAAPAGEASGSRAAPAVSIEPVPAASWKTRGWNALWLCSASAPILVAGMLTPSDKGVGTHQQLGLPPCTFLWLTGFPCPFCGMTTSFAWAAHLHPLKSFATQPAGFLLFLACAAFAPWLLALAVSGRYAFRPEDVLARIPLKGWYAMIAAVALGWAWKIAVVRGWVA